MTVGFEARVRLQLDANSATAPSRREQAIDLQLGINLVFFKFSVTIEAL
jgi:hypothetical protein